MSDPQGASRETWELLALSRRQWSGFEGFLKARIPHFYCLQQEREKNQGDLRMLSAKEKKTCTIGTGLSHMYEKNNRWLRVIHF
jgi:hypothetical protein